MIWFVCLALMVLMQLDQHFFKRLGVRCSASFSVPGWLFWLYALLLPVLAWMSGEWEKTAAIVVVFLFPAYLLQRRRCLREIRARACTAGEGAARREDFLLAVDAIGVVFDWFIVIVALTLLMEGVFSLVPGRDSPLGAEVLIGICSTGLFFLLIARMAGRHPQLSFIELVALRTKGQTFFRTFVLPGLAGMLMAMASSWVIMTRIVQPDTPMNQMIETASNPLWVMVFLVTAVFLAPLGEEILFRGFLYYIVERLKGVKTAFAVSAVLFAVLHVHQYWTDWAAIVMVSLLGGLLTFFRVWTGSVFASIFLHYVYNGSLVIFPFLILAVTNPNYSEFANCMDKCTFSQKEALLKASIQQHPDFLEAYNDLARMYSGKDIRLQEALDLIDTALQRDAERYTFLSTKAELLYQTGRFSEGLKIMKKLNRRFPDNQTVEDRLKKFEEARDGRIQKDPPSLREDVP